MLKIIQLYETSLVRHGFMLIGVVGCGKSSIINILTESLTEIRIKHHLKRLNPKAFTSQEMYGVKNFAGEWTAGVFSEIWRTANERKPNKPVTWIICDGPVDAIWIENLNTVLDDNKVLTLANGDRIFMLDTCKMVFEAENLINASPATVSRCGQIYVSANDLSYQSVIEGFILQRNKDNTSQVKGDALLTGKPQVDKLFSSDDAVKVTNIMQKWFYKNQIIEAADKICFKNPVIEIAPILRATMTLNLFNGILLPYLTSKTFSKTFTEQDYEKIVIYSIMWGVGGVFEPKERLELQEWLKEKGAPLPRTKENETIYEYAINISTSGDVEWKSIEPPVWKVPSKIEFSQLLLPTVDSSRAESLIK